MFDNTSVNILGSIENMSFFSCKNCKTNHQIFPKADFQSISEENKIDFLEKLPFHTELANSSDKGIFKLLDEKNNIIASTFKNLSFKIAAKIASIAEQYKKINNNKKENKKLPVI